VSPVGESLCIYESRAGECVKHDIIIAKRKITDNTMSPELPLLGER